MSFWNKLSSFALPALGGVGGFFAGGPVGALIGAGVGSSISSGFNSVDAQEEANKYNLKAVGDTNATNMAIARENNEAAYKMWLEQRGENRRYYDDTMAFNSAAAQVDRLKQAGLNPALAMYQGVNAGSVSASSAPAPPVRQQPVLQAPHVAPVDYSPISSGILSSLSLLKEIGPALESVIGAKDAFKRAGATTKRETSEASSAESNAILDAANAKRADRLAEAGAQAAESAAAAANYQLDTEKYNSIIAQLKTNALAMFSMKHPGELENLFTQSFIAELQQKVSTKQLTDEQKQKVIKETAIAELQRKKEEFSKSGYDDLIKAINSVDNPIGRSLLHILSTWLMDMR